MIDTILITLRSTIRKLKVESESSGLEFEAES